MSEGEFYQYVNGNLVELTAEEKSECLAREGEWSASASSRMAIEVRRSRNKLLQKSDWMALRTLESGGDLTELHNYRQQLRDIPTQEGFPSNVVWPDTDLL
jgi:hypothetical protein